MRIAWVVVQILGVTLLCAAVIAGMVVFAGMNQHG